jgi:predicted nucleic acid-binding protein
MDLRAATRPRLPLVDALIAASAKQHGAVLVHRDPHMATIPTSLVSQQMLPPKR